MGRASPQQVEEIVQDVLLEAWSQLGHYRPEARFQSWLMQIARFKCSNARRKMSDVLSDDGFLNDEGEEPSILAELAGEQRDALIVEAARNVLEPHDQRLVYLRWVLDRSLPELIEQVEPYRTREDVRAALQRCKRRMKKEIPRLLAERGLSESFLDVTP